MKQKVVLNPEEIINEYKIGIGVETLALKHHVGKLKIKSILIENGVEMRKRGGQKLNATYVVPDWKIEKYPSVDGYHYVAVYRSDGKEFCDHMNQGGFLTSYIKEKEGIEIPTLYDRRKYYMETGNYWWEQWFDITLVENKPTKKCPYCDWETIDVENKSGVFEQHLNEKHNISVEDYLKEFPEDADYFSVFMQKKEKRSLFGDERNFIVCPICNEKLEKMTYWHLKSKHNVSVSDFKKEYPNFNMLSERAYQQACDAYREGNLRVSKNKFVSIYEREICEMLDFYGIEHESSRQFLIGKEIDVLINDKKIGIEFNGLKWHTEWFGKKSHCYHLEKTRLANEKGYGLVHIFEDEYVNKKEIVLNKLKHILSIDENLPRIPGRKCIVKEIHKHEAKDFLEKYHIQGYASATIYLGAFYKNNLVAVMTFKNGNLNNKCWDLNRFASDINLVCQGVGGKVFKYFIKHYTPGIIVSFADRRWTVNPYENLYTKLGFTFDRFTPPDYRYYNEKVDKFERIHKMKFNKKTLNKKYGLPIEWTETEMAKELGYDRIWDCGLIRYVWKNEQ